MSKLIYLPAEIRKMTNKELRSTYSRLRGVANKRIGRLEAANLNIEEHRPFPTMKGLTNAQIERELADVSRYLRDPLTKVRGARKHIQAELEELKERGYDFIDQSNFKDFVRFMEHVRGQVSAKVYDSGDAVDAFNQAQRLGVPAKMLQNNFNYFMENSNKLEQLESGDLTTKYGNMSFAEIRQTLRELD